MKSKTRWFHPSGYHNNWNQGFCVVLSLSNSQTWCSYSLFYTSTRIELRLYTFIKEDCFIFNSHRISSPACTGGGGRRISAWFPSPLPFFVFFFYMTNPLTCFFCSRSLHLVGRVPSFSGLEHLKCALENSQQVVRL